MTKQKQMKVRLKTKRGTTLTFKTAPIPLGKLLDVITAKEGGFIFDGEKGIAVKRSEIESVKILSGGPK